MSSSQVSIKETWWLQGPRALCTCDPSALPYLPTPDCRPQGTGSEKPWQLLVSSRPGSHLGPPRPQTPAVPTPPQQLKLAPSRDQSKQKREKRHNCLFSILLKHFTSVCIIQINKI